MTTRCVTLLSAILVLTTAALADDAPKRTASKIDKILDERFLNVDFKDQYPEDVIKYFGDISGLSVFVDESAKVLSKKLSFKLEKKSLRAFLQALEKHSGIGAKVSNGLLVFASKQKLKSFPTKTKQAKAVTAKDAAALKAAGKRTSYNFKDTPLADCFVFIKAVTGLDILASDSFKVAGEITLRATKLSVLELLNLIASSKGGSVALEDGYLVLLGPKDKP